MLEVSKIHTYYQDSYILQGVSIAVTAGKVVALLGRNGMGKTTTIRSIIGLTPPKRGIVRFRGKEITNLQPYQIAQKGIGLVPQGRQIFPSLTVQENIKVGMRGTDKNGAWNLERIYEQFPILKERAKNKGILLSGGEQQMLTIARALMTNPDLLLMDEPTEGLAPIIVREIIGIIENLKKIGVSVLLVEQNIQMALILADYVYILNKGQIVFESPTRDLHQNKDIIVQYLGATG